MPQLGLQCLVHNGKDVYVDRAGSRAAAAADAGDRSVFTDVIRILVANLLTQPLIYFCTRIVAAGLQRKVREHAGIPDAATRAAAEKVYIADVKTIAGGADKGANTAD